MGKKLVFMNRAFRIDFHNGEADEKTIVSMSVTVRNGKRFKNLNKDGLYNLLSNIETFQKSLEGFAEDIEDRILEPTPKPPNHQ